MSRRMSGAMLVALMVVVIGAGCSRDPSRVVHVGHHTLRLVPPPGWEHLDHGREQLFRNGETELRLEDLGPATPAALAIEIGEAKRLWLAGRRSDALARMQTLHGPPLDFLPSQARADFWRPWTDVTYVPSAADSAALGRAFDEMIHGAEALRVPANEKLVEHVLRQSGDAERREVSRREWREIHGARWLTLETWYRMTHMYAHRVAFHNDDGYLLVLSTDRGLIEQSGAAFDSLLTSIEVLPQP